MQATAENPRYRMELVDASYGSWDVIDTREGGFVVDCLQYDGAKELTSALNDREDAARAKHRRDREHATTRLPRNHYPEARA